MAKKKKGNVSSKAVTKAKDRIVSDKTFGLKNKKKSKKVQKFVQTVKQNVANKMSKKYGKGGNSQMGYLTYEEKQRRKQKAVEEKRNADITHFISKTKKEPEKKPLEDVPPEFIQAVLEQFYQKYSRDKVARIPKIMEKYEGNYYKLEMGLKKQYKDKAPDIQKLYDNWKEEKKEEIDILEQAASWQGLTDQQICIQIEKKRRKLDLDKCTKVTPETFKVWREKKDQEDKKLAEVQAAEEQAKLKATGRKAKVTGRALYKLNASIFQDDEDAAAAEEVKHKEDAEYSDDEGGEEGKTGGKTEGKAAVVQDESLFMDDDDLPSDDD
mmetsp:Transcript_31853/g.55940  ORF Transcript_31853/g.55940 Transcript_31853/m.55940 type:complete len:325 (+) Transcript_31853:102-1076(+)|eukprot:CAMPEP_0197522952 /NCGR_PEP_ID=MMETSP1318-20131121/7983_1 /TAXON_ID=552666 /ORGANISM="Partenskyella glossopodia, Strain RCC365" /LENGTH=324 /DNA_ID=CAMNT_0043075487 /DNA_START=86 /DNA_END=1060 /DNA_ORIENTATION=+